MGSMCYQSQRLFHQKAFLDMIRIIFLAINSKFVIPTLIFIHKFALVPTPLQQL